MSVLNNFFEKNKTVTIQHGNRSHNIARTLQKALISVMTGVILIGALSPAIAQAASQETIQTYQVAQTLKNDINGTINKFDGNYRLAAKAINADKDFSAKKLELEKTFKNNFNHLVQKLKIEKIVNSDFNPSLNLMVKNEIRADASPDQINAWADMDNNKVDLEFNLLGNQSTFKNAKFRLSNEEMKISNEDMFEFAMFHELGHLQNEAIGNFKSSKLTDVENAKISEAFIQQDMFLLNNSAGLNKDGQQVTYLSSLNEVYADTFATISYLKINNFSEKSIKEIEFIRDIRKDNSYRELESFKSKGMKDGDAFIDPYPTHQAMSFILENLNTIKNLKNEDVKFVAQDISSNFVHQMALSNKGKNFHNADIAKVNNNVQNILQNIDLKMDKNIEEGNTVAALSKTMVLKNMQDLRLKVETPVFNTNIKPQ